jgi:hypothetical protein
LLRAKLTSGVSRSGSSWTGSPIPAPQPVLGSCARVWLALRRRVGSRRAPAVRLRRAGAVRCRTGDRFRAVELIEVSVASGAGFIDLATIAERARRARGARFPEWRVSPFGSSTNRAASPARAAPFSRPGASFVARPGSAGDVLALARSPAPAGHAALARTRYAQNSYLASPQTKELFDPTSRSARKSSADNRGWFVQPGNRGHARSLCDIRARARLLTPSRSPDSKPVSVGGPAARSPGLHIRVGEAHKNG